MIYLQRFSPGFNPFKNLQQILAAIYAFHFAAGKKMKRAARKTITAYTHQAVYNSAASVFKTLWSQFHNSAESLRDPSSLISLLFIFIKLSLRRWSITFRECLLCICCLSYSHSYITFRRCVLGYTEASKFHFLLMMYNVPTATSSARVIARNFETL